MRVVLLAASLALLAASGGASSSGGNGAAPAAEPELAAMRATGIAGCSAEVTPRAVEAPMSGGLCGCAVDRLMVGKTAAQLRETSRSDEQDALNACAGALEVTLSPMSDAPVPVAEGANIQAPVAAADPRRENEIGECIADLRNELPPSADVDAFCGCTIDRMTTGGLAERPAMEQCAAQTGIRPRD